jgi:hypothetical protein
VLWAQPDRTLKNGELLTAAEAAGFDVLLTTDKNLRPHVQRVVDAINVAVMGSYLEIDIPTLQSMSRSLATNK